MLGNARDDVVKRSRESRSPIEADSERAPGSRAVAAIRPENLALDGGGGTDVALRGRVVLSQYLGSLVRYEVEAGDGVTLRVDVSDPKRHLLLMPGREVNVGFSTSSAQVFPQEPRG